MDRNTEEFGEQFVSGQVDLNRFLSEYLQKRIEYHALLSKVK